MISGSRNISSIKTRSGGILVILALLFFSSCENDLKDVERIAARNVEIPVDISYGVEIIYSDSAVVKGKLITPKLLHYNVEKPYYEMPDGVTLIMFAEDQEERSRVTADYAIRRESEKLVELRRNVVVTSKNGDKFYSDELIWDESKRRFYSNKLVKIVRSNGNVIYGTGFESDEEFKYPEMSSARGDIDLPQNAVGTDPAGED